MQTETKDRGMIFNAEMVCAIIDGRKTQTRRPVKKDEQCLFDYLGNDSSDRDEWFKDEVSLAYVENFTRLDEEKNKEYQYTGFLACNAEYPEEGYLEVKSPYGKVGDRIWVRETFAIVPRTAYRMSEGVQQVLKPDDNHDAAIFRAGWDRSESGLRWRPSIHMPRWASRILLEITDIRVEHVQDITTADARAEGIDAWIESFNRDGKYHENGQLQAYPVTAFSRLWDSLYGDSWDHNEWVWVIEFKPVQMAND